MMLTLEHNIVLNKICELILDANQKTCFVAVISEKGRILESKHRSGVLGCLSNTKQEMFFMEYALRQMMRKEFDTEFGSVRYTYTEREKEVLFSFPLNDLLVVVSCRIGVNPVSISRKIIPIIDECKFKLDKKTSFEKELEKPRSILS